MCLQSSTEWPFLRPKIVQCLMKKSISFLEPTFSLYANPGLRMLVPLDEVTRAVRKGVVIMVSLGIWISGNGFWKCWMILITKRSGHHYSNSLQFKRHVSAETSAFTCTNVEKKLKIKNQILKIIVLHLNLIMILIIIINTHSCKLNVFQFQGAALPYFVQ